jgi:hypothetical protein
LIIVCNSFWTCSSSWRFWLINAFSISRCSRFSWWQNHVDWVKSLPPAELKLLNSTDFHNSEITQTITNSEIPPEQISYENIAEKSHFYSLRDQLLFMFAPELRREYENYVSQQAANSGYRTLVTSNLQQASDLTVANLFHYFQVRNESKEE